MATAGGAWRLHGGDVLLPLAVCMCVVDNASVISSSASSSVPSLT